MNNKNHYKEDSLPAEYIPKNSNFKNLTGNKYSSLLVLYPCLNQNGKQSYLCVCDCGQHIAIDRRNLISGNTKSCGCNKRNNPKNRIDLKGQKFGRLTVAGNPQNGKRGTVWECLCECGQVVNVVSTDLKRGNTKSCGCLKKESNTTMNDLTHQVFGRLTALYTNKVGNDGQRVWTCRCSCGNLTEVLAGNLRKGNTSSCGCINSVGNYKIRCFLNESGVNYKAEYSFADCLSDKGNPYRFDFAVFSKENKLLFLIEYHGNIHFTYRENGWNTEASFKERLYRDERKKQYCINNSIPIFYINYKEDLSQRLEEIFIEV